MHQKNNLESIIYKLAHTVYTLNINLTAIRAAWFIIHTNNKYQYLYENNNAILCLVPVRPTSHYNEIQPKEGGSKNKRMGERFRKRKEPLVGKKFAADCGMEQTRISSKESHGFIR